MANATFLPLPNLKAMVAGCRDDIAKARQINATLVGKVAAMSNRKQYTLDFIKVEVSKMREVAAQEVSSYLVSQKTYQHLWQIAAQAPFWTVEAFLLRAPGVPDPVLEYASGISEISVRGDNGSVTSERYP